MSQEQETTAHHCHSISSSELCVRMCEWAFIAVCFHYYVCVCVFVYAVLPPQALLLLGTVCVVWMGVKFGCRVNSSLVRFGTLQEGKWSGEFVSYFIFM